MIWYDVREPGTTPDRMTPQLRPVSEVCRFSSALRAGLVPARYRATTRVAPTVVTPAQAGVHVTLNQAAMDKQNKPVVTPAKAGVHVTPIGMDPRLCGNDDDGSGRCNVR